MDARLRAGVEREPRILGGEAQHRGEPAHDAVEHRRHRAARRAPARRVGPVAVERILADVEVERREIDGAEIVERHEERVELVGRVRLLQRRVQLDEAMQHEALELRQLGIRHALRGREVLQGAEQVAQRVAQPAIDLGLLLQDLGPMRRSSE
jgi:hypothetical protein